MSKERLLEEIRRARRQRKTELDLSGNELTALPPEIGRLTQLRILKIDRNKLSSLPREIGKLINLEILYLSDNKLSSLPAEIGKLRNLKTIYLERNQLTSLPAEIGQLINLQSLNLYSNQLSSLPAEIGQLSNLQFLYLERNQLISLPAEIGQLINLQILYLYSNQLSSLPAEIGQLTNLQSLNIYSNQLSSLPAEIGQLTNLKFLYLERNQLSSLPVEIEQLTKLEKLNLTENPISIPPEILERNVEEILDFYFRIQEPSEIEPLYEAKLLIIGEPGAGKTSLAKKIEDKNYQLNTDEKSTKGIDVIQWKFPLPNGKEFRVNIWDFGGQEIYHQTHQFFLTKRSIYVLLADSRREDTNFYWWLKVVELLSDNSPVLIVKNEKKDRQCEVNERQLRGEFTNLEKVLATNLATNRGLKEIKSALEFYIKNLPHVGDASPLPKVWIKIRSAIEKDSRDYIGKSKFEYLETRKKNYSQSLTAS